MKKMLLVFAVAGMAFGFSSCKKDYTCECDGTVVGTFENTKKSDAEDACDAMNTFGTYTKCEVSEK
ncbi:MAG: hypothetical protein WD048_17060 [Chitinophagales bacterium]